MPRSLSDKEVSEFRDRLCIAASRLFAENGASGVTMRGLAAALDVSAMTPYRYFHDKNEILAVLRARAFDSFSEVLENAYEKSSDAPGASTTTKAVSLCTSYVRFALEHPDYYKLMFDLLQPGSNDYATLNRAVQRAKKSMITYIQHMIPNDCTCEDTCLLGLVFWSTLHGIVSLELTKQLEPDIDIDSMAQATSELLVHTIHQSATQTSLHTTH